MIPEDIYKTLKIVVEKFSDSNINWVLVGSCNLAIQGVELIPNDIDILTDREEAYKAGELLKEYEVQPVQYREAEKFKSHFGKFNINGVEVEIMGDLENKTPTGDLWSETTGFNEKVETKYKDLILPTISLDKEFHAYTQMGRHEKAKKIKAILDSRIN